MSFMDTQPELKSVTVRLFVNYILISKGNIILCSIRTNLFAQAFYMMDD